MKIQVFSDMVCPWCYIGERRLARALEAVGGDAFEVEFKPFQLDPSTPVEALPLTQYLEKRFAGRPVDSMMNRVTSAAAEEGITMAWQHGQIANTRTAHRLMAWTMNEYGEGVQRALAEQLFALHFTNGGNIGDVEELAAAAALAGVDADRARAHLNSSDGVQELDAALASARSGVQSVPTYIIDDRYVIQGAQPLATFVATLEEAIRTRK
jgi:predicted DsbA family dithiol-disulfide isomerase